MIRTLAVSLFVSLVLFYGCESIGLFQGKFDEGNVEYEITYLDDEKSNPIISLLPTTMELKFKEGNSVQKIEGWMGIFSMSGIANLKIGKHSALLKIMNEKYCYETDLGGPSFGFDTIEGMKVELVESETKEIAGYVAKKAMVSFPGTEHEGFPIYYTDEITLKDPNCHNPYTAIPGVLLEYEMSFQKIRMVLKATKVEKVEILDEVFNVPKGYEKVPIEKMVEVINNLM